MHVDPMVQLLINAGDMTMVWAHSPGDVCDASERELLQQCWKVCV